MINGKWEKGIITFDHQHYQVVNDGIQDFSILIPNERKVGKVQVGWLPINWSKRFVDSNTPVLNLHHKLSREEKLHIYSLLVLKYAYHNH